MEPTFGRLESTGARMPSRRTSGIFRTLLQFLPDGVEVATRRNANVTLVPAVTLLAARRRRARVPPGYNAPLPWGEGM